MSAPRVTEDRFLGALLGMAIGDAIGSAILADPGADPAALVAAQLEGVATEGDEQARQQISPRSEIALAIVESLTTNDGFFDFDNIHARIGFIAQSASRERMSGATLRGLEMSGQLGDLLPEDGNDPPALEVATRGIPFGLLHAVGTFDLESLAADTSRATRLTHRGTAAADTTLAVALAVVAAAHRMEGPAAWVRDRLAESPSPLVVAVVDALEHVTAAETFEAALAGAIRDRNEADARGAIAGAVAGAWFGVSDIPQHLIDGLDARIYLTLAAPWFYRTALRRQGTVIDLRQA